MNCMGEVIVKFIDFGSKIIKDNYKKPKLWLIISMVLLLLFIIYPYIDANLFYYSRIEKRIEILKQISELNLDKINSNSILKNEYLNVVNEIKHHDELLINNIRKNCIGIVSSWEIIVDNDNFILKFITGAFWSFIVTLCVPFMNTFKKTSDKIIGILVMIIFTIFLGFISSFLPTIINPMVNYIGVPLIQLVVVSIFAVKDSKKRKAN